MLRKTNFLSISVLLSVIATFLTKKRSSREFPGKFLKKKEKHSLAVCGSFWGEKLFFLFDTFYWFDQKDLF